MRIAEMPVCISLVINWHCFLSVSINQPAVNTLDHLQVYIIYIYRPPLISVENLADTQPQHYIPKIPQGRHCTVSTGPADRAVDRQTSDEALLKGPGKAEEQRDTRS